MRVQAWIVIFYIAATVAIGLAVARKRWSAGAFHGAALSIPAVVCASAGEWLGGTATSGVAEYGFLYGISGMWYTLANALGVLFLALFFARLYRRLEKVTVPGIVERYFGVRARVISSLLLIVVMLAVGISQMMALGKLGQSLLGMPFAWSVLLLGGVVTGYTMRGGMKAVAATNRLHLFIMYAGVILAAGLGIAALGGGSAFRDTMAQVSADTGTNYLGALSIGAPKIISWLVASALGACTAQAGIQPVLAAKDEVSAKKACFITAAVVAPFGAVTATLGMIARAMSERGTLLAADGTVVTEAKLALPTLMLNLPPLVGGVVLASILAAILSTAAPIFLAVGTMLSRDIASLWTDSEKTLIRVSRFGIGAAGLLCMAGAMFLVNAGEILDIVYGAYSLRGAIFIILLYGIYWKHSTERAACVSLVVTALAAVIWIASRYITGQYPLAPWFSETYAAVLTAAISLPLAAMLQRDPREPA